MERTARRWLLVLTWFVAISALAGGVELVLWPRGNTYLPISLLQYTPFSKFTVPGLLLGGVVGGASAVAAILLGRRSEFALDAVLIAGGALTVWIAAEVAQFREIHWLHVVYGACGVALFGLGAATAWRAGGLKHRWWLTVSAAETIGFLVPVGVGLLTARAGWGPGAQAAALVAAGCAEGVCLGTGQASAMPVPIDRRRFVGLTALAAGLAWGVAMGLVALGEVASPPVVLGVGLVAGLAVLAGMGGLQWLELGRRAAGAWRWVGFTALAWSLALPWSFAPSPFVDETTPVAAHAVLWACGGWLMASTMAVVTWHGARSLRSRAV